MILGPAGYRNSLEIRIVAPQASNHPDSFKFVAFICYRNKKYDQEMKTDNSTFVMPKKNKLRQETINILCQLIVTFYDNEDGTENVVAVVDADSCQQSLENN